MYVSVSSLYFISLHSFIPYYSWLVSYFQLSGESFLSSIEIFFSFGETRFRHVTFKRIDMMRTVKFPLVEILCIYCEITHCWVRIETRMIGMWEWNFHWLKLINWLIGLKWKTWCTWYRFNFLIHFFNFKTQWQFSFDRSLVENLENIWNKNIDF